MSFDINKLESGYLNETVCLLRNQLIKTLITEIYWSKSLSECNWYLYITDLEVTVADHETRLTAAEENIEGRTSYTYQFSFI